jgi:hypothetical protein
VEDRLIFNGIKTTSRLQDKYKQAEISQHNRCSAKRDRSREDVVDRLYHYKEIYDARKLEKQLKAIESVILIH